MMPWCAVAAASPQVVDYVESLAEGVNLDWTTLSLTVVRSADAAGTRSRREAVEQVAREKVAQEIATYSPSVRVQGDLTLADLAERKELADPIASRLDRWVVSEARYYASGRVELVAELSLRDLLKPWTVSMAAEPPSGREPAYTGLMIDARQSGAAPAFAPRVLGDDGAVLYGAVLAPAFAAEEAPVVYVSDPGHPAAARAGDTPMHLRAAFSRGTDLVLDRSETLRFRTSLSGASLVGRGSVVIVLDAP